MRLLFALLISLSYQLIDAQKIHTYPIAPKDTIVDIYFSDRIEDPYQWMENPEDIRLSAWLEEQKDLTKKLSRKQSRKLLLEKQLRSMYNDMDRESLYTFENKNKKNKVKYIFKNKWNSYSKSPDLLYKKKNDTNFKYLVRSKDFIQSKKDHIVVKSKIINEKEDLAVVTISRNGSDWLTGYIFDFARGKFTNYTLNNLRIGSHIEWHGKDLYFDAYDAPIAGRELLDKAKGQKLYKLSNIKDSLITEVLYSHYDIDGTSSFNYDIIEEKLFLYHGLKSRDNVYKCISVDDLSKPSFFPQKLLVYPGDSDIKLSIEYIKNDTVLIKTNWNAPNYKVLLAQFSKPNQLEEFIPEYDVVLESVDKLGGDKLACRYSENDQDLALIFSMKGELLKTIDFPKGKKLKYLYEYNEEATHTFFSVSSFYHPELWYDLSLKNLSFKPAESLTVPYDADKLETRYEIFISKDGTEIPMYITCKKNIKLDGTNPVLLYGYGGYGNTIEPFFNESNCLFVLHGGVLAIPNVRGGGAKGSTWAEQGRRLNKQNAIDDFIGAAEYLIDKGYTCPKKLAINGGSHGGLLVGAAITQRPDLYKAAIAEAGVLDMLRFSQFTVGSVATNINEFGIPDNTEDYKNLKSYSPLHNIKRNEKYPDVLLISGDNDDRVPPHHSYKFLARLQECGDSENLFHIYITPGSGHGGALTPKDALDVILYKVHFLIDQMDIQL